MSLIEWMVIVAIIAILTAIMFPVFAMARWKTQQMAFVTGNSIPTVEQQARMSSETIARVPAGIRQRWPGMAPVGPSDPSPTSSVRVTFSDGTIRELVIEVPPGTTIRSVEPIDQRPAEAPPTQAPVAPPG